MEVLRVLGEQGVFGKRSRECAGDVADKGAGLNPEAHRSIVRTGGIVSKSG